ncbi:2-amino-4-hydroxy-6-hydroxymethyldihydropteridine pyrophosphokinase [Roseomonas mucosa]|uniref:2-amino-4-hydroxy-6- hydroxymethyldihydropteridine diphosphokinase n=1 Tax=Roseomonas TaxID=125216 RepID=UPI000C175BD7|nr:MULTISPECIES: 2-amino-4-hydroxy-6-hydroxymethyldihydropteridine diphosphokinase [Roseomonas]ATR20344.1 2-amino-4-hydroxy-6-hydroxymethyldihydropteridine diphosphokinase [Roseomonas sp. FDAARGOS_362]QDJ10097.1 2-amino-4-hydroxy-6-hydroxymethyldihydropteridine pyrophosphokinase [Roseomonas mucosa]UZO97435.1 2-amino-4-hydroxy-6-hydroxymethyldihydropteridine pyrophosphokinase [Roseomonas mucosa]
MSGVPEAAGRPFADTLVALGANLPAADGTRPLEACRRAASALDGICGLPLVALSNWWETPADPPDPRSPPYVNGVARLRGTADPLALLRALQAIEDAAGRVRPYPNAPRTLDLDLIAVGGTVRGAPDPVLPHPRAHLRRFVLLPLAEVAPGWRHPVEGPVEALLERLPPMPMRRL